jgi:hypothetical protein
MIPRRRQDVILVVLALTALLFGAVVALAEEGDLQPVRGTKVRLAPPPGWGVSTTFAGFQHVPTQSSIMVQVTPAPYAKVVKSLTAAALRKRGMTELGRETIERDGRTGLLVHLEQPARGAVFRKWMYLFGDERHVVITLGTFPRKHGPEVSAAIRRAVLTAREGNAPAAPRPSAPDFGLRPSAPLKLGGTHQGMLLYTESGKVPTVTPGEALLIAGKSSPGRVPEDREAFAKRRLLATEDHRDIRVVSSKAVEIDGMKGFEVVGRAKDRHGAPTRLFLTILFTSDRYYLLQGLVREEAGERFVGVFRKSAATFARHRGGAER